MIYTEPNKFAQPYSLTKDDNGTIAVRGYQNYNLFDDRVEILDSFTTEKFNMVSPYLKCKGKSVLDIGSSGGLYSLFAKFNGAAWVSSVEMDKVYADGFRKTLKYIGNKGCLDVVLNSRITDVKCKGDIVLSLAMIHWLYSCTETFGSLDKVISYLKSLTHEVLILEWIDPSDPCIKFFKHTDFNPDVKTDEYTKNNFLDALLKNFGKVEFAGELNPTREIYVVYNRPDIGATSSTFINKPEGRIAKTVAAKWDFDVFKNELFWLNKLKDCVRFPDLVRHIDNTMVLSYEGEQLTKENLPADWREQANNILELLDKYGCSHNDIKPTELLVKNGELKLIDFGWASKKDEPLPENYPPDLGGGYRYSSSKTDDSCSLFKVLEEVNENNNSNTVL